MMTVSTWAFTPPYLPGGVSIAVAKDGDDARQHMLFESPGSTAPADWPPEKRGALQHCAGLGVVREIALMMPPASAPSAALKAIAGNCAPYIRLGQASTYAMHIRIASFDNKQDVVISLPMQPSL
jgi:hypothetical protein